MSISTAYQQMIASLKTIEGVAVVYYRGTDTVSITALVGDTRMEMADEYGGTTVTSRIRDYIVKAGDLVISSVTIEPQAGDEIRETRGSSTYVYAVMAAGADEPFRPSDRHGNSWRIHTKLVDII